MMKTKHGKNSCGWGTHLNELIPSIRRRASKMKSFHGISLPERREWVLKAPLERSGS